MVSTLVHVQFCFPRQVGIASKRFVIANRARTVAFAASPKTLSSVCVRQTFLAITVSAMCILAKKKAPAQDTESASSKQRTKTKMDLDASVTSGGQVKTLRKQNSKLENLNK